MSDERQKAAAELVLRRREIRRSFLAWCEYALADRGQKPALHHRLIIDTLQKVTEGKLKRVMMLLPPGSAKSTYTSILYVIWNLCVNPKDLVLACSYSYELIEGFGRECRNLIEQHSKVLGYSLSRTASAAGDWRIDNNIGGYFCAGVNAGIAGHRADKGFIDDYLGTEQEADSKVIRDQNYWWYRNDFSPRLKPDAAQFIIANRRHEDDLVGRLLLEEGEDWTVIKLPMLAEDNDPLGRKPGELLWPEWFGMNAEAVKKVEKAKKNARTWAGLYQQRPAPEEGAYFKTIATYRQAEFPKDDELRIYVGADYAYRKGQENDKTCFVVGAMDRRGRLFIVDWFWARVDTLESVNQMLEMAKYHKPIVWWAGRESITGSIAPFLYEKMAQIGVYIPIEELSEARDKEQKAQPIKARMSAKMVLFPSDHPQWSDALHELLTFPNGTHDDFVDAIAKLGQGLDKMVKGQPAVKEWDGEIPEQKLTCGWVQRSAEGIERKKRFELVDN